MAKLIEGSRDPQRLAAEKIEAAVKAVKTRHKGKPFKTLPKADIDELLEAMAKKQGFVDENGNVIE